MNLSDEQKKWDALYSAAPISEMTAEEMAFNEELAESISALLPSNASILEAGCGSGGQSLALAKRGFQVTLMDFSEEALFHARELFARHGTKANFVQADILSQRPAQAEFDLVFNAGVLEHYNKKKKKAFIQSMANCSREYILVLVPNRMCYWYWIWRSRQIARDNWPYGKEVPLGDLAFTFKAAGLSFVGQRFMADAWTESFIMDVFRAEEVLRDEILRVHRSPIVQAAAKSYLLAGLGTKKPVEDFSLHGWTRSGLNDEMQYAQMQTALSDTLALLIGAQRETSQRGWLPQLKRMMKGIVKRLARRR